MISCNKCSAQNAESRKFCGSCGNLMVLCCRQCGFANTPSDNYCGGCGIKLSEMVLPDRQPIQYEQKPGETDRYSYNDISELMQEKTAKPGPAVKKKEVRGADPVSQDLLDSIFDETDD